MSTLAAETTSENNGLSPFAQGQGDDDRPVSSSPQPEDGALDDILNRLEDDHGVAEGSIEADDDGDTDTTQKGRTQDGEESDDEPDDDILPEGVSEEDYEEAEKTLQRLGISRKAIEAMSAAEVMELHEKIAREKPEEKQEQRVDVDVPTIPEIVSEELGEDVAGEIQAYVRDSLSVVIRPLLDTLRRMSDIAGNSMAELARIRLTEDFPDLKKDDFYRKVQKEMEKLDASKFGSITEMMRAAVGVLRATPEAIEHERSLRRRRRKDRARGQMRAPKVENEDRPENLSRDDLLDRQLLEIERRHGM